MVEQNNFAVSEFINNKRAESNFEPIKNRVRQDIQIQLFLTQHYFRYWSCNGSTTRCCRNHLRSLRYNTCLLSFRRNINLFIYFCAIDLHIKIFIQRTWKVWDVKTKYGISRSIKHQSGWRKALLVTKTYVLLIIRWKPGKMAQNGQHNT